jgi:hypothetical protein
LGRVLNETLPMLCRAMQNLCETCERWTTTTSVGFVLFSHHEQKNQLGRATTSNSRPSITTTTEQRVTSCGRFRVERRSVDQRTMFNTPSTMQSVDDHQHRTRTRSLALPLCRRAFHVSSAIHRGQTRAHNIDRFQRLDAHSLLHTALSTVSLWGSFIDNFLCSCQTIAAMVSLHLLVEKLESL